MPTKRKKTRPTAPAPAVPGVGSAPAPPGPVALQPKSPGNKKWSFLIYLCGDHQQLEPWTDKNFIDLCAAGSQPDVHVVVQYDRRDGARRFILPEQPIKADTINDLFREVLAGQPPGIADQTNQLQGARVNTGEPEEAINFFRWGIQSAPSERVMLIFSGLGISPNYIQQRSTGQAGAGKKAPALAAEKLFSVCHDETSGDDLESSELLDILTQVKATLPEGRTIDVVAFDLGAAAFVEIAYQMEGLANLFVASQTLMPDDGWPYLKILGAAQEVAASQAADPALTIACRLVDLVIETYPGKPLQMAVIDLGALRPVGRALDTLSLALMQSLGDWHVLEAVSKSLAAVDWVSFLECEVQAAHEPDCFNVLPAVDLMTLLEQLHQKLRQQSLLAPEDFGQRARLEQLVQMSESTINVLRGHAQASLSERDDPTRCGPLIRHGRPLADHGLSIMLPPTATPEEEPAEKEAQHLHSIRPLAFDLGSSNYVGLQFAQSVHWVALVSAFQLIKQDPHILWRLISSMLADVSGPARDALLERLVSPHSIVQGMRNQFQVLQSGAGLTVSLEPIDTAPDLDDSRRYRLRLESALAGATVRQQESRLYESTLISTLRGLEQLLTSREYNPTTAEDLEALGRTLGEDLIQDLAEPLCHERGLAIDEGTAATPHLRLQLPGELMRYPWELMHDRYGMLCERFALGRQVFTRTQRYRPLSRREPGPIQVLVIGDPTFTPAFRDKCLARVPPWRLAQLSSARQEAEHIVDAFDELRRRLNGLPELKVKAIIGERFGVSDLRKFLRTGEYDIIHYAGHACFSARDPEGSGWLLSDGLLRAREIRNTLAWGDSPPWLVFANACEAGMDAGGAVGPYQGDVFGLATAFINQGVAAYIGPLWPVSDAVASQLAIDFYNALLLDNTTLGEALRYAKVRAKERLLPPLQEGDEYFAAPRVILSWASMALYGDPTSKVLQSLWTPHSMQPEAARPETPAAPRHKAAPPERAWNVNVRPLRQASMEQTRQLVAGPGLEPASAEEMRGDKAIDDDLVRIELIEINGLRSWQIVDRHRGPEPVSVSGLPAAARTEQVRGLLGIDRGLADYGRVVGRWVLNKVTGTNQQGLLRQLVEQFDHDTVRQEGLLLVESGAKLVPLTESHGLPPLTPDGPDRVLLLIHGTFSKTASPVAGLGEEFLERARRTYRAVLGFDHWTLSKTPEENAQHLWTLLPADLRTGKKIDIISHSRGGLVARAFIELCHYEGAVRRVVFAGTPNCGTNLANPRHWGQAADVLVNLIHTDPSGVYGKLSGFLMQMLVRDATFQVPGLQAQNPEALGPKDFLGRLQKTAPGGTSVDYVVVSSNYEPGRGDFNLKQLLAQGGDSTLDSLFGGANDLVVDTAHVWAIDGRPDSKTIRAPVRPERVLLFNTDSKWVTPEGVTVENLAGVHHTNIFTWAVTRQFIAHQLEIGP